MDSKAFPPPPGARSPAFGPLPPRNSSANAISPPVIAPARRKRGPAGRETTHPLTVMFPQRPELPMGQQSNAVAGSTPKVGAPGLAAVASSAPVSGEIPSVKEPVDGSRQCTGLSVQAMPLLPMLIRHVGIVSEATKILSLQSSSTVQISEKAN